MDWVIWCLPRRCSAAVSRLSFPLSLYWVFKWRPPPPHLSTRTVERRPLKAAVSESTVSAVAKANARVQLLYCFSFPTEMTSATAWVMCVATVTQRDNEQHVDRQDIRHHGSAKRDSCAHEAEQRKENCDFEGSSHLRGHSTKTKGTTSRNGSAKRFAVTMVSWTLGFWNLGVTRAAQYCKVFVQCTAGTDTILISYWHYS